MYAVDAVSYVTSHDASILWLWKAHNTVNKRLVGEASEDPLHPKIQYPSRAACPSCWTRPGSVSPFRVREVLLFLKNVYSKDALSLTGVYRPTDHTGKGQSLRIGLQDRGDIDSHIVKVSDQDADSHVQKSLLSGRQDMSSCLILYGVTTIALACLYFIYHMRKRIRRKQFIEMYKNPWVSFPLVIYFYINSFVIFVVTWWWVSCFEFDHFKNLFFKFWR